MLRSLLVFIVLVGSIAAAEPLKSVEIKDYKFEWKAKERDAMKI